MSSMLSCVLVGSPPSEKEQGFLVGQVVLGVVVGLLCVVLGLVLGCVAVTCLMLMKGDVSIIIYVPGSVSVLNA